MLVAPAIANLIAIAVTTRSGLTKQAYCPYHS